MRRTLLSAAAMALVLTGPSGPAHAASTGAAPGVIVIASQSYLEVIAMLEDAGYKVTGMKSTLLGRLKIRAQNDEHLREVVVSRSTGEIKSDRILRVFADKDGEAGVAPRTAASKTSRDSSSGGGSSSSSSSSSSGGSVSVSAGSGGASVSTGSGGVSASAGSGGVSASVGGTSVSIGK